MPNDVSAFQLSFFQLMTAQANEDFRRFYDALVAEADRLGEGVDHREVEHAEDQLTHSLDYIADVW